MKRVDSPSVRQRISALIASHRLDPEVAQVFESLLLSLADEHSPTAVRDPEAAVDVHLADSLTGLDPGIPGLGSASVIADIGSGCGIPGLVLAAAIPSARVVAVESIGRKCDFISEAASRAGLTNVQVVNSRVEEWSGGIGSCDAVTARAVDALPVLAEYAAPLLVEGGVLVAWKGNPSVEELDAGRSAAADLGLEQLEPVEVEPWPGGGRRKLVVMRKKRPTPDGYPRRAGIASKRPLA